MVLFFLAACGNGINLVKMNDQYNEFMGQAETLAEVICGHSEFSSAFWVAALGSDADRLLPGEARKILDRINEITAGKECKELNPGEKGEIFGMWLRFMGMVTESTIKKVVPYMAQFIAIL